MKINKIVSLGSDCITASYLTRMNLKTESHPFDWIQSSSHMINHCIDTKFEYFLKNLSKSNLNPIGFKHEIYSDVVWTDKSNDVIFLHHDPTNNDDIEYFNRCIHRFNKLFDEENILYIMITNRFNLDDIINLSEKLNPNYLLVIKLIHCDDNDNNNATIYDQKNLKIFTLKNIRLDPITFDDIRSIEFYNILKNNYNI